jgi:hypothetical protein
VEGNSTTVPLLFTREQFFDLFVAYNQALWPVVVLLWAVSVVVALRLSATVYSLAYPAINAIDHRRLLRIPTFGLPCPTTVFTVGVLMLATPQCWSLSVVPLIWSGIGGSAAFLLGVPADVALPMAGLTPAVSMRSMPAHAFPS